MRRSIAAAAVLGIAALAFGQPKKLGWSTGYYTDWAGKPPSAMPWASYTHMCYFSLMPSGGSGAIGGVSTSAAKTFVTEAHKHNVKAIICVGGDGTDGNFNTVTANATARAAMVKNIVNFVEANGFDGVDMDWESKSESAGRVTIFKQFHQEIRTELDRLTPRKTMTAAIADWYPKCSASLFGICDQLNAMSYWSKVGAIPGFMSGLIKAGIPKTSLGVGMGFDTDGEVGNDLADCVAKVHFTIDNGYGGIMVWEVSRSNQNIEDSIAKYVDHSVTSARRLAAIEHMKAVTLNLSKDGAVEYTVTSETGPSGAVIDLGLYNMEGARLKTLVSGRSEAGVHRVTLEARGAYVVRLTSGAESASIIAGR